MRFARLRGATVCYFHGSLGHTQHLTINDARYDASPATLTLPVLEDYESVQMAIMQVLQKLTTGHLDRKTAGLLLYGLQIASSNLRYARFDPRAESVVIDPTATHLTPLDGDQWSDEEDEEQENEEDYDDEEDGNEEDLNEELGDDAELEATEEESSAGIPPATVRAPSPCASSVGAAASPPAISNPIAGVKKSSSGFDVHGRTAEAKSKPESVGADAPVRPRAERVAPPTSDTSQRKTREEEPPRISDAQFFQALANLCDHRENGTPLKFPVYPASPPEPRSADISAGEKRPPATVSSATDGNRKEEAEAHETRPAECRGPSLCSG